MTLRRSKWQEWWAIQALQLGWIRSWHGSSRRVPGPVHCLGRCPHIKWTRRTTSKATRSSIWDAWSQPTCAPRTLAHYWASLHVTGTRGLGPGRSSVTNSTVLGTEPQRYSHAISLAFCQASMSCRSRWTEIVGPTQESHRRPRGTGRNRNGSTGWEGRWKRERERWLMYPDLSATISNIVNSQQEFQITSHSR